VCVCVCVCVRVRAWMQVYACICGRCLCVCTYTHIHVYTHTCIHTFLTYTRIYTDKSVKSLSIYRSTYLSMSLSIYATVTYSKNAKRNFVIDEAPAVQKCRLFPPHEHTCFFDHVESQILRMSHVYIYVYIYIHICIYIYIYTYMYIYICI